MFYVPVMLDQETIKSRGGGTKVKKNFLTASPFDFKLFSYKKGYQKSYVCYRFCPLIINTNQKHKYTIYTV